MDQNFIKISIRSWS